MNSFAWILNGRKRALVFYSCIDTFIRMGVMVVEVVDQIFFCKYYKGKVIYSLDL